VRVPLTAYQRGYRAGYLAALWGYAHWKDGVAYVGSTGQTHKEAEKAFLAAVTPSDPDPGGNPDRAGS